METEDLAVSTISPRQRSLTSLGGALLDRRISGLSILGARTLAGTTSTKVFRPYQWYPSAIWTLWNKNLPLQLESKMLSTRARGAWILLNRYPDAAVRGMLVQISNCVQWLSKQLDWLTGPVECQKTGSVYSKNDNDYNSNNNDIIQVTMAMMQPYTNKNNDKQKK